MNQFQNFIQLIPLSANEYNPNQAHIRGANLIKYETKYNDQGKKKRKKTTDLLYPGLPLR